MQKDHNGNKNGSTEGGKERKKMGFFEISDTLMLLLVCGQETRP